MNKIISIGESEKPDFPSVVFCVQFYDHVGGAESQLIKQMPHYRNTFRVKVITQGNLSTRKIANKSRFLLYCIKVFLSTLFAPKGTVFYFIGSGTEKVFFLLANKCRLVQLHYVVKFTGTFDSEFENYYLAQLDSLKGRIIHRFYEQASTIIIQDELSIQYIKKHFDLPHERIVLIRNGVRSIEGLQSKSLGRPLKVLFVGRMIELKGIFKIIQVARRFKETCEFHLVGNGPDLDAARDKAKGTSNVHFHGRLPHEMVENIYEESDIFLFPSRFREGLPNVVFEAMSHCLPVIATRVGALPELFSDRKELLFLNRESLSVTDIAHALELLLKDDVLRKRIAEAGYINVKDNFSIEKSARENINLIKGIISES